MEKNAILQNMVNWYHKESFTSNYCFGYKAKGVVYAALVNNVSADLLAKLAKTFADTTVTITKGEKTVKATQLMMLMSLAVKNGDSVTVKAEGPAEDAAIEAMEKFFKENL